MEAPDDLQLRSVDFAAVFTAQPTAYLVMSPELVILEANPAYLQLLGRTRDELVGRWVFDAFPPAADSLDADGTNPLQVSFERARDSGRPDHMPLFHYDVLDHATGLAQHRAWSLISVPVLDDQGTTTLVLQRVEDVTDYLAERERLAGQPGSWQRLDALEADLFARTQEVRAAVAAREAATVRLAGLAAATLQLATAATVREVVEVVSRSGLTALGADGGAVGILDAPAGVIEVTMSDSLGTDAQEAFARVPADSRRLAAQVIAHGEPVALGTRAEGMAWSADMAAVYDLTGHHAWLGVPLVSDGRVLGCLLAAWREEHDVPDDEVELVQAFATQCAQALQRLQQLDVERTTAAEVRAVAETLQRSMLTAAFEPDHSQIAVRYLPASDAARVGGDWYDAFLEADGATNLVIGDVVGHDIAAAASMGQLRSLLRGIVIGGSPGPAATLATLDTAITQLDLGTYATVGLARLEQTPEEKQQGVTRLRWASAGHPPPVVIDQDATLSPVPEPVGHLMLGVDRTSTRGEVVVTLRRGSTVVLYTDGLVERPGEDLAAGTARLEQLLTELGGLELEDLCDQLLHRLVHGRPVDDVALVAVRLHRQDRPRPPEAGPLYLPDNIPASEHR